MNKIEKILLSTLVMAILAFSSAATMVHAYTNYASMPWASNSLVNPGTLTIAGSSTVAGPACALRVEKSHRIEVGESASPITLTPYGEDWVKPECG